MERFLVFLSPPLFHFSPLPNRAASFCWGDGAFNRLAQHLEASLIATEV